MVGRCSIRVFRVVGFYGCDGFDGSVLCFEKRLQSVYKASTVGVGMALVVQNSRSNYGPKSG